MERRYLYTPPALVVSCQWVVYVYMRYMYILTCLLAYIQHLYTYFFRIVFFIWPILTCDQHIPEWIYVTHLLHLKVFTGWKQKSIFVYRFSSWSIANIEWSSYFRVYILCDFFCGISLTNDWDLNLNKICFWNFGFEKVIEQISSTTRSNVHYSACRFAGYSLCHRDM